MITMLFYLLVYFGGLLRCISGKPVYGLYVYFFSFYFHAPTQWWGESLPVLRWSLIAALVTMIALFIYPPKQGLSFWRYRENKLMTAFSLLVIAQLAWVNNTGVHLEYVMLIVKFVLLIFLMQNIMLTSKEIKRVILVNVLGGAFLAYIGFGHYTSGRLETFGNGDGWDSNLIAQHFSVLIILGGYLLMERFTRYHLLLAFGLSVVLYAFFLTESRSAIIAMALTGVIAVFFPPPGKKKQLMGLMVLGLVACSVLMGPQILDRFNEMAKPGESQDKSAKSRMVIIKVQMEMFKASPWVGHGHRGTLLLSPKYVPAEYQTVSSSGRSVRASHNVVMSFLVDHGLIGALLYFATIISCGFRIFNARYQHPVEVLNEHQKRLGGLQVAGVLALVVFMVCGLGSNNKKLEADIWLIAFIPLISRLIKEEKDKLNLAHPLPKVGQSMSIT